MLVETAPNESTVKLLLAKPKSDVNWERDIAMFPAWAKNLNLDLGVGTQTVLVRATHPRSKLVSKCNFTVTILGK